MARPELRPYQQDAVAAVIKSLETNPSTLLVMATGLGKTQVAASVAEHYLPGKILFVAHRKELVHQGCDRLELVTGYPAEIEMAELRASLNIPIVAASLDSMTNRLEKWPANHFSLLIFDECFPAGTLVDGKPIESYQVGDTVQSVDHETGTVQLRRVSKVFIKLSQNLVRLMYGETEVTCTGNHPVFAKGRGYVEAKNLVPGDLLCVRKRLDVRGGHINAAPKDVFPRVSSESLVGDYGAHQSGALLGANEAKQSNAKGGDSSEGLGYPQATGTLPEDSWRQWTRDNRTPGFAAQVLGEWVGTGVRSEHAPETRERVPGMLQAGPGLPEHEDRDRSGREQPRDPEASGSGFQEDGFLVWVGVDRVESLECGSTGTAVYNLEVEGSHTYFANDTLVHNCHHSLAPSYKKVLDHFTCPKMGMTATPDRGDEKALGKVWQDVAGVWDIVDGIEGGYLVPIKGRSVRVDEINLSAIGKTAGDLAVGELDAEMVKHIEGIVQKTLELEPGRRGIWFFPGVKSAELACERIRALGQTCAFVSGETPREERDEIMRGFKNGTYQHLTNCQVATEGFDAPAADMVVIGRPTLSRALYAQMVGRGLRVLPGTVECFDEPLARRNAVAASAKPDCAVVDFAGNAGKHTLVSPEDLLGGDYSDEEVQLAKKAAKEGVPGDVLENLAAARRELKAMMAKIQSNVKATVQSFNPFAVLHMEDPDPHKERFREPMTEGQAIRLKGFNLKDSQMKNLSKLEAQKLIGSLQVRRNLGLCSLNQLSVLSRHVNAPVNLSFRKASQAMTYLSETCKWNPSAEQRTVLLGMVSK